METTSPEPAPEESGGWEEGMESEDISQEAASPQNKEEEITADTKNLQMEVNTLKTDMEKMQADQINTQKDMEKMQADQINTQKDMEKMQADQINMQTAMEKMQADQINTQKDMKNMQEILNVLQTDLVNPHQKSAKAPNNSDRSEEPPYKGEYHFTTRFFHLHRLWGAKATVKVFLVVTGQTFGADQVILEQVKRSPEVEITRNLQECDFIIVFCPILSRVGSDVEAAMREDSVSSGGKPVILVLMHHTRDPDYSTDVRRWSETFQNVVLDVHVLFHQTQPGLLRCSRNDRAVKLIQEKLKKPVWWPF